jgi:hypothetical protein
MTLAVSQRFFAYDQCPLVTRTPQFSGNVSIVLDASVLFVSLVLLTVAALARNDL